MSKDFIPRSAKILREKNVGPLCSSFLGTCIGHLIDCGLNDLEILTVVEDLLKMRTMVNDPAMRKFLEKIQSSVTRELQDGGG